MKIALAQIEIEQGEFLKNIDKIDKYAKKAKAGDAQIVVFPEMCVCGFNYKKNLKFLKKDPTIIEELLCNIAQNNDIAICASVPHLSKDSQIPTNRLLFIGADGNMLSHYDKIHLFSVFNEDKYVKKGDEIVVANTPFGEIGLAICYDIRFPDIFVRMAKKGAKVIILSAAFPHPRSEHWTILSKARAIENQCFLIAVNHAGTETFGNTKLKYFGMSTAIDPWGGIIAECPVDKESITFADINLDDVDNIRSKIPSFKDRRDDIY